MMGNIETTPEEKARARFRKYARKRKTKKSTAAKGKKRSVWITGQAGSPGLGKRR